MVLALCMHVIYVPLDNEWYWRYVCTCFMFHWTMSGTGVICARVLFMFHWTMSGTGVIYVPLDDEWYWRYVCTCLIYVPLDDEWY